MIEVFVGKVLQPANGDWFKLPMSVDKIYTHLAEKWGVARDQVGNMIEVMASDYDVPFDLTNDYPGITELNHVAQKIIDSGLSEKYIRAFFDYYSYRDIDLLADTIFEEGIDAGDWAFKNIKIAELSPEIIEEYFDFEAFGNDVETNGEIVNVGRGLFIRNPNER